MVSVLLASLFMPAFSNLNIFSHLLSDTIFNFANINTRQLMRYRYLILFFALFCFTNMARAQQVITVKGVISKGLSGQRVAQVIVKNLKSKDLIESDDLGWFSIKASIGDTLLFTKNEFTPLRIAVTSANDIPVYLQPAVMLDEVKIQGQTKRQEMSEIMGQYKSQGTFYDGKPPVLSFLTSPITGLYELFGATPNRAKRFAAFSKGEIEGAEVDRRYNQALVKRVTNASDTVVKRFMEYYKPSFEDLKEWNDYELIKHINEHYSAYSKANDQEKLRRQYLQPLVKPGTPKAEPVRLEE